MRERLQIPGFSLIPFCRSSSAFFPVTRQRTGTR
ncbi:rho operon leader peptide [Raoultella planticola]|nr:rho operon leader peptide [Raoultella ornithinolytica]MBE0016238.1 rho operon leader peptide [Raoultella planticola]AZB50734.1 rho operon leader peptide [Raoultella ornithinolytica]KAB8129721.1 rho operon leader peptide [Raoultella ornithinolytica]KAB8146714.1 rho operon leader peptide [Raoultella ornithinolytica]